MKKMRYAKLLLAGLSLALLACTKDREPASDFSQVGPAVMDVTLHEMDQPMTRQNVDNTTDFWTTKSFSAGDRIGLMATAGMVGPNGEVAWVKNEYMDYYQATGSSNYRFRNDDLLLNTGAMSGKVGRYVYFPYTEEMPIPKFDKNNPGTNSSSSGDNRYYFANPSNNDTLDEDSIDKDSKGKKGLLLRETVEGVERCVDYMYISNISITNGALSGGFYHGFCELVIVRGTGFDEVPDELRDDIWVVLNSGFTRLTLSLFLDNSTGQYSWRPKLWPDNWSTWKTRNMLDAENRFDGKTEAEAKRWQAWPGKDYMDTKDGQPNPRKAWYAILPSAHNYSHTIADYIEIYDDNGIPRKVSNFELYVSAETGIADRQMRPGKRYAIEIMMTELGATARPVEISDWSDDDGHGMDKETDTDNKNNITDIRTVGIKNYEELQSWAGSYNQFITGLGQNTYVRPKTQEDLEKFKDLKKYGDYDLTNQVWKFYITDDIDLPETAPTFITDLQDELEGAGKIENYSVGNLRRPLAAKISQGGVLRNLDFNNLYVRTGDAGDTAGALVGELSGGTLENCNIVNGTMIGTGGTVGMLCGTVRGGTVRNCTVSGAVVGTTSGTTDWPAGLFGSVTASSFTYENNDASGLIVKSN